MLIIKILIVSPKLVLQINIFNPSKAKKHLYDFNTLPLKHERRQILLNILML